MKTFIQFVNESHYDWSGRRIPVVKNPTAKRVHAMIKGSKEGHVRWIRHTKTGDVHVWSGDHDYVHDDFVHADYGNHDHYERGYGEDEKDAHYIEHMGRARFKERLKESNQGKVALAREIAKRSKPKFIEVASKTRNLSMKDRKRIEKQNKKDVLELERERIIKTWNEGWEHGGGPIQRLKDKGIFDHLVPALKHETTGEIHTGKRGQTHLDIKRKDEYHKYHTGFVNRKSGEFHHSSHLDIDTPDLMTKTQRMRYYATEGTNKLEQMKKKMGREYLLKMLNK